MTGRRCVSGRALGCERGQSLVELIACVPLVAVVGLLCLQALAAGSAYVYADNAVHVAALAEMLDQDGRQAARDALPGWTRGRLRVISNRRRVEIWLTPRALVPPLARLLTVHVAAPLTTVATTTRMATSEPSRGAS